MRTSLNPRLQSIAKKTLADGLVRFDEQRGWRGPVNHFDLNGDWGPKAGEFKAISDIPWKWRWCWIPARTPPASASSRSVSAPAASPAPVTSASSPSTA